MPNWCSNVLRISGDAPTLQAFKGKFDNRGDVGLLGCFLPIPEELRNVGYPTTIVSEEEYEKHLAGEKSEFELAHRPITARMSTEYKLKHGADNWYQWANSNWGTKWDAAFKPEANFIYLDQNTLQIGFDTAWAPPQIAIETISSEYPTLTFTLFFEEPGMNFEGMAEIHDGEVIDSVEQEYTGSTFDEEADEWIDGEPLTERF